MANIYLVSRGRYSDYRIVRAFSTEEKANDWVGQAPDHRVEEFTIDDESDKPVAGLLIFMDLLTGNMKNAPVVMSAHKLDNKFFTTEVDGYIQICKFAWSVNPVVQMFFPYLDKEKAIKSCNEKRCQLIALGNVEEGYYDRDTLEFIMV